jgi:ABC-type phosphate transport system permease subunit
MKAAYIMLFGYITMIGIPVLLMLSSFVSPFSSVQLLRYTMNILVSIGSIVYGIVAIRAIYLHSERRKR